MRNKFIILFIYCALSGVILQSCGDSKHEVAGSFLDEAKEEATQKFEVDVDPAELREILDRIPPPIEISSIIQQQGLSYDRNYLNPVNNLSNYKDSYSQALNLGIYGTNLGYTHLYHQTSDGIDYLEAVVKLSKELEIGHFFGQKMLSRLTKSDNLDSLLKITTDNFDEINSHFLEHKTPQLSILLLAGGWLESMNLLIEVYEKAPNEDLKEKICEQKIVLSSITESMNKYSKDEKILGIYDQLKILESVFEKVTIEEVELDGEQEMIFNDDGSMTFISKKETRVIVDKETLEKIINTTKSIRKKVI